MHKTPERISSSVIREPMGDEYMDDEGEEEGNDSPKPTGELKGGGRKSEPDA